MNQKIKNSEHPYFPTSPVQDQFGQIIVAFGVTKREEMAFQIYLRLKKFSSRKLQEENINDIIAESYKQADLFLNFFDKSEQETLPKIIM